MRHRAMTLILGLAVAIPVAFGSAAGAQGRPLATAMTGEAEAPGPGDPDASGFVSFTLNQGEGRVCFDLSWADIDGTVTGAHIHVAPPGEPGPIVVPMFAGEFPGTGSASDCVGGMERALIKAIRQDPGAYYVNVHSTEFPAGAIRGQLGK